MNTSAAAVHLGPPHGPTWDLMGLDEPCFALLGLEAMGSLWARGPVRAPCMSHPCGPIGPNWVPMAHGPMGAHGAWPWLPWLGRHDQAWGVPVGLHGFLPWGPWVRNGNRATKGRGGMGPLGLLGPLWVPRGAHGGPWALWGREAGRRQAHVDAVARKK